MTVYFDHPIEFPGLPAIHHLIKWHETYSILAVSSKNEQTDADGTVNFFLDEGELVEEGSLHRSVPAECMEWHPVTKVIAIGWRSGEITTYNYSENLIYEQSSIHRSPLAVIKWNQNGSRLVSGDASGLLVIWKVDAKGKLHPTPLHQHRLSSGISHIVMLHPLAMANGSSSNMAKKTSSSVLDAYSWQSKSAAMLAQTITDPISCFCTTGEGVLCFMSHSGDCVERFRFDQKIHSLLLNCGVRMLSIVTQDMFISQFTVTHDGQTMITTSQAKLSGKNKVNTIICVAQKILASCSDENVIRFWDFENSNNFVLDIHRHPLTALDEIVTAISYNCKTKVLAGGTSAGNLMLWKWVEDKNDLLPPHSKNDGDSFDNNWEFITSSMLAGAALHIAWGSKRNLLSVNSGHTVQIFSEHVMNSHFNDKVSAVQLSPGEVHLESHATKFTFSIHSEVHIKGIYVTRENVAIWSGKRLEVYSFPREKVSLAARMTGSFSTTATVVALHELSVYVIEDHQIKIKTFQGTVKQTLSFMGIEGSPVALSVTDHYLACGTSSGYAKLWDISRREARLQGSRHFLSGTLSELGSITSVLCNTIGSRISIIVENAKTNVVTLAMWFVESDAVKVLSPSELLLDPPTPDEEKVVGNSPVHIILPQLSANTLLEQQELATELVNRIPISHVWDPEEPQVLAVEWAYVKRKLNSTLDTKKESMRQGKYAQVNIIVSIFFITPEMHILISEVVPNEPFLNNLMGISVPYLYYSKKGNIAGIAYQPSNESSQNEGRRSSISPSSDPPSSIAQVTMRDFLGLENSGAQVIHAMVEFSYHVAVGNMDEAFKSIKLIKNKAVWESMAKMCIKTQRLDVALVCLGNMGNVKTARAIKQTKKFTEPEVKLAILAVQLGMLDEAERLYKKSKRHDLLNEFYQYSGEWAKAMEVAEVNDRMHLKTTYYNYARHAEDMGELTAAIKSYEKSCTHVFEVPRMLLDDSVELENYVMKSKDKGVRKWWAEYLESMGEWEQAMQFYETAKDFYSLVRILCFNGQLTRAAEIVEESGCKAAAYHLARRLSVENEDLKKAIHFFVKSQCYSPAIQLAKENGLNNELMNLALLGNQDDKLGAAKYYEEIPETIDKAILLFHKAGEVSHALDLCFDHNYYEVLDQIAEDLDENSNSATTQRVADYFMEKGLFDKAMEILVRSKRTEEAVRLCTLHSVPLTEELVEKMSVEKKDNETKEEAEYRIKILEQLADCCLDLGSYHLAAKKYTQSGNRVKAMKALLKSGDTEKIVFFAGVSRQKDIYIMAANYLQSLDWRKDRNVMKNIITFYTKGKALDSLAGFYDACAQVEIDEFQNYSKAMGALEEAIKILGKIKSKNPAALTAKLDFFKERAALIKTFAEARQSYEEDPEGSMALCQGLLDEPRLDTAVRVGDVFGLMIEHNAETGNHEKAYALMTELQQRVPNVNLTYYINIKIIENIHTAMGVPLGRGVRSKGKSFDKREETTKEEEEEDEVESDIEEG